MMTTWFMMMNGDSEHDEVDSSKLMRSQESCMSLATNFIGIGHITGISIKTSRILRSPWTIKIGRLFVTLTILTFSCHFGRRSALLLAGFVETLTCKCALCFCMEYYLTLAINS